MLVVCIIICHVILFICQLPVDLSEPDDDMSIISDLDG